MSAHLVLDLFQSSTPVLWPLLNESFWIPVIPYLHIGSAAALTGPSAVHVEPTVIERFTSFGAPVLTGESLVLSAVLLAPTLVQILLNRLTTIK